MPAAAGRCYDHVRAGAFIFYQVLSTETRSSGKVAYIWKLYSALDTGKATLWLLLTYHVDILLPFKYWSHILFLLRIVHLETGEVLITS